ncbi:hypothetical protein HY501_03100 [Candidatus Woesearchaeota archaeon]|nr:hypothetical protein [Candidatus Woesearchaeota archaeon]
MALVNGNLLNDAPSDKYFWCKDGKVIRNLREAVKLISQMDQDIFSHHVNSQKNDFATWIADVFQDEKLAEKIREKKSKRRIAKTIEKRLDHIEKELILNAEPPKTENLKWEWFKKIFIPKQESMESIRFLQPFIKGLIIGISISLVIIIILTAINFIAP